MNLLRWRGHKGWQTACDFNIYPWRTHFLHENHVAVNYSLITFHACLHKKEGTVVDQCITILLINNSSTDVRIIIIIIIYKKNQLGHNWPTVATNQHKRVKKVCLDSLPALKILCSLWQLCIRLCLQPAIKKRLLMARYWCIFDKKKKKMCV